LARIAAEEANRKVFKEGRLVHRTEPEIKTHTSYLVFAVLPREWTAEDEAACRAKWPPEKVADQSQANVKGGKGGKQGKGKDKSSRGGKGSKSGDQEV